MGAGIEFDNFEDELKFFKEFSEKLDFTSDNEGQILFILDTPEDIEHELGINRNDYKTRQQKIDLVGQFAFRWNNYVYNRVALSKFFGVSKTATTYIIKASRVEDKIQWE